MIQIQTDSNRFKNPNDTAWRQAGVARFQKGSLGSMKQPAITASKEAKTRMVRSIFTQCTFDSTAERSGLRLCNDNLMQGSHSSIILCKTANVQSGAALPVRLLFDFCKRKMAVSVESAVLTLLLMLCSCCCYSSVNALNLFFGLRNGYYDQSCPEVESIVYQTLAKLNKKDPDIPADILRLHFHDCFVRGCDASVLLDGKGTEKAAPSNARLEGFQAIDTMKAAVERACPGVVSCADILAFAARDAVVISNGPDWEVPAGRRDGKISIADEAEANLPGPQMSIDELVQNFARQGLSKSDMVVLSGAHTIGDTACHHIDARLYKYPGSRSGVDPIIPPDFVKELKKQCPKPGLRKETVHFDRITGHKFDTQYYNNLVYNKGVLASDQLLYTDMSTRPLVNSNRVQSTFFTNFVESMIKMSKIAPPFGASGEIRTYCRAVNTQKGRF